MTPPIPGLEKYLNINEIPDAEHPLFSGKAVLDEIEQKGIDLSRWGKTGQLFAQLSGGMHRETVYELLGQPDFYPEDKTHTIQYNPDGAFNGGKNGPDWSLRIHFVDNKVTKIEFSKSIYGPPPG